MNDSGVRFNAGEPVYGIDGWDPWTDPSRLMPLGAFIGDDVLDDPDRVVLEDGLRHSYYAEARAIARMLTDSSTRVLRWSQVSSMSATLSCLDQQLTHRLGDTQALAWLVFSCCDGHEVTVARHPQRAEWRCYRGCELPGAYDIDALHDELLIEEIRDEQQRAAAFLSEQVDPAGPNQHAEAIGRNEDDDKMELPEDRHESAGPWHLLDRAQLVVLGQLLREGGERRRKKLRSACGLGKADFGNAVRGLESAGVVVHRKKSDTVRVDRSFKGVSYQHERSEQG